MTNRRIDWKAALLSLRKNLRPLLVGFALGALFLGVLLRSSTGPEPPAEGDRATAHSAHDHAEGSKSFWTCAMHPQIRQPEPGDCPICGMDLIPVKSKNSGSNTSDARIELSPRAKQLAQLRTTVVRRQQNPGGQLRLLGRVEANEGTQKNITAWIGGRIDRLLVNTTGERVQAGQVVARLYSPEVYAAHQDLITAAAQLERMSESSESSQRAAKAALQAARQRLALLGVPKDELERMEKQSQPTTSVSIRSPFSGTVMERLATEGSYVTTGARLYSVADLGSLWILLDAYESDLPLLSVGQTVSIEVEAYPGESFEGEITFIEPTLDQRLRTSKVRVEVKNKNGKLRPGMFAQAVVSSDESAPGAQLVIPASAPLFTGRRAIVYVNVPDAEGSMYEARTVRLGPRLGDTYPVVAGLSEGEVVVTRGAFALDADLQIKGGRSMMMSPDDSQPSTWDNVIASSPSSLRPLRELIELYLSIQTALSTDDLGTAKQSAASLGATLVGVSLEQSATVRNAWIHVSGMLTGGARHVAQADSLESARKGFEHLSGAVIMLLRTFGNPMDVPLFLAHCPMARGSEGASWIQKGTKIENSYFGEAMRSCGDIQEEIQPGAHLEPPKVRAAPLSKPMEGHQH